LLALHLCSYFPEPTTGKVHETTLKASISGISVVHVEDGLWPDGQSFRYSQDEVVSTKIVTRLVLSQLDLHPGEEMRASREDGTPSDCANPGV
jgi:hypothetical protein